MIKILMLQNDRRMEKGRDGEEKEKRERGMEGQREGKMAGVKGGTGVNGGRKGEMEEG